MRTAPASVPAALRPLDDAQVAHYRDHGWVALGRILDDAELTLLRAEEARFRPPGIGAETIFVNQVCDASAGIRRLCGDGAHLAHVERLLGTPDVLFFWNQFVTKRPDDGSGRTVFPWHQDCGYVDVAPLPLTVWVALDDVDEANGCVWIQPGSHRDGLLTHVRPSADNWHLQVPVEGDGVPARLKAGEAVAFTGYTLHRSLPNRTDRDRRAFFMEYAPATAVDTGKGSSASPMPGQPLRARGDTWMARGQIPLSAYRSI